MVLFKNVLLGTLYKISKQKARLFITKSNEFYLIEFKDIMYKYRINIKKVSGRLNESVLPSKNLIIKTKTQKSNREVFAEASKFFKKKYGLVIESADIITEGRYAPGKSYKAGGVEYMDETQDYVGAVVFLSPTEYKLKFFKTQSAADKFITK